MIEFGSQALGSYSSQRRKKKRLDRWEIARFSRFNFLADVVKNDVVWEKLAMDVLTSEILRFLDYKISKALKFSRVTQLFLSSA